MTKVQIFPLWPPKTEKKLKVRTDTRGENPPPVYLRYPFRGGEEEKGLTFL